VSNLDPSVVDTPQKIATITQALGQMQNIANSINPNDQDVNKGNVVKAIEGLEYLKTLTDAK